MFFLAVRSRAGRLLALTTGFCSLGWCATITVTGAARVVAMPASLVAGAFESDSMASLFPESTNVKLLSDLPVDVLSPGTYSSVSSLTPGTLAAGMTVSDVYFHADPVTSAGTTFTGSATFDTNILGVIALSSTLNATDGALGLRGVTYDSADPSRGLEIYSVQDHFSISADRRTLNFTVIAWSSTDDMRIVLGSGNTATTFAGAPEPGTTSLFLLGLSAALWLRLRRPRPALGL